MANIIQPGEQYKSEFIPADYRKTYFDQENQKPEEFKFYATFILQTLRDLFLKVPEGEKMIEVGNGPCVHQLTSPSGRFKKLYLSDYVEANRKSITDWLLIGKNSFDWSDMLKIGATVEGIRVGQLEARIRAKIRQVLPCDVLKPGVLELEVPGNLKDFDCVLSMLCLEAASKDYATYCQSLVNLSRLAKPKGHVIISGLINEASYEVGPKVFHVLKLDRPQIEKAVVAADMEVIDWIQIDFDEQKGNTGPGMFFLLAQRKN